MAGLKGKCLCGAVSIKATSNNDRIDACHCSICRKWTAGPMIAVSCGDNVEIDGEENLTVYRSSQWAERLFCKKCGTSIAWRLQDGGTYHVAAHIFAGVDELPLGLQIFVDEKPDNYNFAENTETMTGAEVFAEFAGSESQ